MNRVEDLAFPSSHEPLVACALWYALVLDCAVFPCQGKKPLINDNLRSASTDTAQIEQWWRQWPDANIGVPCGRIVVVDIDPRHDGDGSLLQLQREHGALPQTATVSTGGTDKGKHLYFRHPIDINPLRSRTIAPGIDVRAHGAYVIGAGSIHPETKRRYQWAENTFTPTFYAHLPVLPDWVTSLLNEQRVSTSTGQTTLTMVGGGQRNITLTSLAGSMRRKGSTAQEILAALITYNARHCDPPLGRDEVARIAHSVGRYDPQVLGRERLTDAGNAQRLLKVRGNDLRFDVDEKQWRVWDGTRWALDVTGKALVYAREVLTNIYAEAAAVEGEGKEVDAEREALRKWAQRCGQAGRPAAALEELQIAPDTNIVVLPADLDADPLLFNCQNGVLDLRTGRLAPHDPSQLLTKVCPWSYDEHAPVPPRWQQFVEEALPSADLQEWAQQFAGYCLSGLMSEQSFHLLYGTGGNGKGTFINVLCGVLGEDYVWNAPQGLFEQRQAGQHTTDIASIRGHRLVVHGQLSNQARLNLDIIKQITGGDPVTARHLNARNSAFRPQCKLLVAADRRPQISEASIATWDRMRLVPFNVRFRGTESEKKDYAKTLLEDAPGILAWAVAGFLAYQKAGKLPIPEAMAEATAAYRNDSDLFGQFLDQWCVVGDGYRIKTNELLDNFKRWLDGNGFGRLVRGYNRTRLEEEARHQDGLHSINRSGVPWMTGVTLRDDVRTSRVEVDEED